MTETTHVLTLIAKPLTADHVEAARAALPRRPRIDWLAADEACDLYFETAAAADVAAAVRRVLAGQPVDLHCRPNDPDRRCRLMIADMDSTMITVECIDEMAAVLGERKRIAEITERAMQGDIDFADALRERAAILAGLEEVALQWVYDARIHLSPGARELVATMRAHGAETALVSGGFDFFTERVSADLGFDHHQANGLSFVDGLLDGTVREPILDPSAKLVTLRRLMAALGLPRSATLAVGDGANDLPMVQAAGLGVAYHAKPVLARAAAACIDHGDLTALLYLQGYRREEIST